MIAVQLLSFFILQTRNKGLVMSSGRTAKVTFTAHNQNLETIHAVVAAIVSQTPCTHCGRLINLAFEFQGDPPPDLAKQGVVSVQTE
jgi:hypothetical protein